MGLRLLTAAAGLREFGDQPRPAMSVRLLVGLLSVGVTLALIAVGCSAQRTWRVFSGSPWVQRWVRG